ncbi:putative methyltransferase domain protein [Escherichia coli 2-460-02_S1_C2]|nr:putative methyltransferase domain protein [Escherichia coli 2-460-02_S1_C2]
MDLNEASLNAASTRAGESKIKHKISHDVFDLIPRRYMVNLIPFPCFTFFTACLEIYLQKAV